MSRVYFFVLVLTAILFSEAIEAQEQFECTSADLVPSRLVGGMYAEVITEEPLPIRDNPSVNSEPKAMLEPGTRVYLASGVECLDGLLWWQVSPTDLSDYVFGWAAEQVAEVYQLAPVFQSLDVPQDRQRITIQNLDALQRVAAIELDWPAKVTWSLDTTYLVVNSQYAVWVYDLINPDGPSLQLPPIVGDVFSQWGGVILTSSHVATSGMPDGDLRIVSLTNGDQKVVNISATEYAGNAAFTPDLSYWATAYGDGSIQVWDTNTGSQVARLEGHTRVGALVFSPDGQTLISGGGFDRYGFENPDPMLHIWNVASKELKQVYEFNSAPYEVALTVDGNIIAVPDSSKPSDPPTGDLVHLIDLMQGSQVSFPLPNARVRGDLSFSPDGGILAITVLPGNRVILLDTANGDVLREMVFDHILLDVEFSPDGTLLAIAHWGMTAYSERLELWAAFD